MIRTEVVKLSTIPATAYRQKLPSGRSGIVILRSDFSQPGIAFISEVSGEAIPSQNTSSEYYPEEAFQEAITLTAGFPFERRSAGTQEPAFKEEVKAEERDSVLETVIDSDDYQMVIDAYTDRNGRLSYSLLNKDLIKFSHSSSTARKMLREKFSLEDIRFYSVSTKIRTITGNADLTDEQIRKIIDLLEEVSPKGLFKEFNDELRRALRR